MAADSRAHPPFDSLRSRRAVWRPCRSVAAMVSLVALAALADDAPPSGPSRTLREVGRAHTGSLPKGVTLSPDGHTLAVTNFGQPWGRSVDLFDAETLELLSSVDFHGGNAVESIWSPDGATLYVSDFRNHEVRFIDVASREVRARVGVEHHPKVLALSPDGATLYASCWASGSVCAVDVDAEELQGCVEVGRHPRGMSVSPDGSRLWVVNYGSDDLHEIDTASLTVLRHLEFPSPSYPRHVVRDREGRRLFVSGKLRNVLWIVDVETLAVSAEIPVGECPKTVALSPDEAWVYTANYCSHDVSVVDLASLRAVQVPIDGLKEASGLALNADGSRLWVTGWSSKDLVALEPVTPP
ncbi:MAG: beta-propeller fold lactonase family protein [Deltaproteobacteria bacterium]|nr:beta-propeller fold lactonase family protein [Deltaproteobacteria bacterium]